ncbi:MAG: cyclodeaminase/cyclohydrolase family protein [Halolamina sp.]
MSVPRAQGNGRPRRRRRSARPVDAARRGSLVTPAEESLERFLSGVASTRITPSAGAVVAVTGAQAAALCEMVCIHTDATETTARLTDARERLGAYRESLLQLAADDVAAVDGVQATFDGAADAEPERAALRRATAVPLQITETARDVAEAAVVAGDDGAESVRTDAVVGAYLARASVASGAQIVRSNLDMYDDESFVRDAREAVDRAESDAEEAVAAVVG